MFNHIIFNCYDCNAEVTLQCDASEKGLGAARLQNGQPIPLASKTLPPTEKRYAHIYRKGVPRNRVAASEIQPVPSSQEKLSVESKPLQAIFKKSVLAASCRLQRMLLGLQRLNLDVMYQPGLQMYIADHLSRPYLTSKGDRQKVSSFADWRWKP